MGFLRSLPVLVLVFLLCFEKMLNMSAQSTSTAGLTSSEARALDALLQDYAYRALVKPKTGKIYDGKVPSNLTGIEVAALRLRSGSLRRRGVQMYKEFEIRRGLLERPYVERLVLVYQNLGNLSERYYPLPNYKYLAPVLGLLAYDGSNLSATHLRELHINASGDPILVKFQDIQSAPDGTVAKCVRFDLDGSSNLSDLRTGNTCSTYQQGHFSIVVQSTAPLPAPTAPGEKKSNRKVRIIVGSVVGGLALLGLLALLVLWLQKFKQKKKMQQMERAADMGEALHMASVGDTKAPAATVTRTQPTLEQEYAP